MKATPVSVNLDVIRAHLGERTVEKLTSVLQPTLDAETKEAAYRHVTGEPGDRIRRLKDRAAFAAGQVRERGVRTDGMSRNA